MSKLLKLYDVRASTFYDAQARGECEHDKYSELRLQVRDKHALSYGSAGQRMLIELLKSEEISTTRYMMRKIMREEGLVSKQRRKKPYPKGGDTSLIAPNLLTRQFDVTSINRWWSGDITYVWTQQGWVYLAVVIDLMSRRVIAHEVSSSPNSQLTAAVFNRAFESRGQPQNVVFHSDQGCQYSSAEFQHCLKNKGVKQSMSRRGNCWDNAPTERFFGSYKSERMPKLGYENIDDALADINHYIDYYYNCVRPHTANNGLPPIEAEYHAVPTTMKVN